MQDVTHWLVTLPCTLTHTQMFTWLNGGHTDLCVNFPVEADLALFSMYISFEYSVIPFPIYFLIHHKHNCSHTVI